MNWKLIVLSLVVCTAIILLSIQQPSRAPQRQLMTVSTEQQSIFAPGRVEGNSPEIELFATLRERIVATPVVEGQVVRAGETLVQLEYRAFEAEVELAKAGVQLASAELERLRNGALQSEKDEAKFQCEYRNAEMIVAKKLKERGDSLASTQAISKTELDQFDSNAASAQALWSAAKARWSTITAPPRAEDLQAAEAKLSSAKARLQIAEATLSKTRIIAPRDGQVLQINVEVGELPGSEPLVIMCDTNALQVRASVDEFDALRIRLGQPVRLTTNALPGQEIHGQVARIRPRMHHKELGTDRPDAKLDTRAREIWVDIQSKTPLIVGLPVELWIDEAPLPNSQQATRFQRTQR